MGLSFNMYLIHSSHLFLLQDLQLVERATTATH